MAACRYLTDLRQNALCSICQEFYKDPVIIDCGHDFCRFCLTKYMEQPDLTISCPECKQKFNKKNLKPNKRLANMVEIIQRLEEESVRLPEGNLCGEHGEAGRLPEGSLCEEHGEALRLFCDTGETLVCLVCRETREHKEHRVRPIKEAHEDYKDKLYSHMEHLKKELKDLQEWIEEEKGKASELEVNIMKQRDEIVSTFEHLKQFLEQVKQQLLSRLKKEQKENMKKIKRKLAQLEKQQNAHKSLITEIESKCQQQDVELLKDVKSILGRCSEVKALKPQENASAMKTTLQSARRHAHLQEKLTELKEIFPAEIEWRYVKSCECEVTLDPGTAHPRLIVSEDGRSVRGGEENQDLPDTPQRFTHHWIVLGRQGLRSGRHYWEVVVGGSTAWSLGVCDESVTRKEWSRASPQQGLWTVGFQGGEYVALTSPDTHLTPRSSPRVLGLFLDYEAGRLSVYNARHRSLLFTFPVASFPRTLRPYFEIWKTEGVLQIIPGTGRG